MLMPEHVTFTSMGASGAVWIINPSDPIWTHTTVSQSSQAAQKGSQWSECREGSPRVYGFLENATAWQPRSAIRRISLAASSGSHKGTRQIGMNRPGYAP